MANFKLLIVLFGIFCFGILETLQMDVDDDLILTYKEKLKLDEVRNIYLKNQLYFWLILKTF